MSHYRNDLGRRGEETAASYLASHGITVLARNYRTLRGEIDLVVVDPCSREVVFVEVKTRRSNICGLGEESVTPRKARRLWLTALDYLGENAFRREGFRFDVIVIDLTCGGAQLRHYRNVLGPGGRLV
jgi:putative endonuclease